MKDAPFSFRQITIDLGSQELTEEYIRKRAYQIYEQRGREDGHDKEDWYQAEAEIVGKKPIPLPEPKPKEAPVALGTAA